MWKTTLKNVNLSLPSLVIMMLHTENQPPSLAILYFPGWVAGGIEIKVNSIQFQLKLPVGTELGKIQNFFSYFEEEKIILTNSKLSEGPEL